MNLGPKEYTCDRCEKVERGPSARITAEPGCRPVLETGFPPEDWRVVVAGVFGYGAAASPYGLVCAACAKKIGPELRATFQRVAPKAKRGSRG